MPKVSAVMVVAASILFRAAVAVAFSSTPPTSYPASPLAAPASWRPSRADDFNPPAASTTPAAWGAFDAGDSSTAPAAAAASTTTDACKVLCAADIDSEHLPAVSSGAADVTGKRVDSSTGKRIDSSTAYSDFTGKRVDSFTSSVDYDPDDFAGAVISARPLTTPTSESDPHQFMGNYPPVTAASGSTIPTGASSDRDATLRPLARRFLRAARVLRVPVHVRGCDSLRLAKLVINTCSIRGRGHDCCDAIVAVIGRGQGCFCAVSWEAYYRQSVPEGGRDMLVIFHSCTHGREPHVEDNCETAQSLPPRNIPPPAAMPSPAPTYLPPVPSTSEATATAPSTATITAAAESCRPITKPDWIARILAIVFGAALCGFVCMWMQNDSSQEAASGYESSDSSSSESSLPPGGNNTESSNSCSSVQSVANIESSVELVALDNSESSPQPLTPPHLTPDVATHEEDSGGTSSGEPLLPPPPYLRRGTRIRRAISRWLFDEGV